MQGLSAISSASKPSGNGHSRGGGAAAANAAPASGTGAGAIVAAGISLMYLVWNRGTSERFVRRGTQQHVRYGV